MTSWKTVAPAVALALGMTACSKQPAVETLDDSTTDTQQLPFERAPNRKGLPPTSTVVEIPAGTFIPVHLQTTLSSATARDGEAFEAVLDEPIVIRGKTVARRGTMVTGRVVAAKPSDNIQTSGYLRLTLSAISLKGRSQPIQTSSIFAKGGTEQVLTSLEQIDSPSPGAQDIQVPPSHRLTFRLKETVPGQP
jgi:hypothetical protein